MIRTLQYLFLGIIVTTVGFSLYQWNASRASTQKTAPNNGLVGYWSFDENTGTQAGDASGNNNTGTLTNGPTWGDGKKGQAINFDGTNDYITMGDQSSLEINNNSLSFGGWFYINAYPAVNNRMFLITKGNGGGFEYELSVNGYSTNHLVATLFQPGGSNYIFVSSNTVPPLNTWFHVMAVWDKDAVAMRVYYNGVLENTSTTTSGSLHTTRTAPFEIGRRNDNAEQTLNGKADEVRIYNRALSAAEIMNIVSVSKLTVSPTASLTSGLVGYWTFDGKDTPWSSSSAGTATDRSGNSNTGTLTNMSQSTSPAEGKLGQALNFDGSNDHITLSGLATAGATTLSAWIYPNVLSGRQVIIGRLESGSSFPWNYGYGMLLNGSTLIGMSAQNDSSWANNLNATIQAGVWQHVVFTITGSSGTQTGSLYVNGVLVDSYSGTANPYIYNPSIGCGVGNFPGSFFNGKIDDVRSYSRALSATEVQSLYDLGASDKVNSSVSQNQGVGRLDSGLVGYWKLDDASGTNATDSSVNANTGTLTNGPAWGTGQIGGDVVFTSASSQQITVAHSTTLNVYPMTASAWVKATVNDSVARGIIGKYTSGQANGYLLDLYQGHIRAWYFKNGSNYVYNGGQGLDGGSVNDGVWHFVSLVVDSSGGRLFVDGVQKDSLAWTGTPGVMTWTGPLCIGLFATNNTDCTAGSFFDGSIDEARVYNRALSTDEIVQLYRLTAPTGVDTSLKGYWSFDGSATNWTSSSAGTATDRSGNGNTGTLTNMNQSTSIAEGKLGQALNFDGVDDYVSIPTSSALNFAYNQDFSVTLWAKVPATQIDTGIVGNIILQKWSGSAGGYPFAIRLFNQTYGTVGDRGKVYALRYDATNLPMVVSGVKINDSTWHHIGYTKSGSTLSLYIDGNSSVTTATDTTTGTTTNAHPLSIGSENGVYFLTGSLDEVRVYNRALTATEVAALYNAGR